MKRDKKLKLLKVILLNYICSNQKLSVTGWDMNVDIVRAVGQRAIPSVPEPSAVISLLTALPTVWGKKYNRLHT